jgi:predicted ATPase/DNA-binding SARP family transcriptional activator
MSGLKLWLLGPPRIEVETVPVEIQRRKALALLVYLAVTGESQPRDSLATLFWPENNQSNARTALRRDLSALNKALGRTWLEIDRERVGLERKTGLWMDVEEFQSLLAACRTHDHPAGEVCPACLPVLSKAVELYRADFLTGFTLPDCPEFDEWEFFHAESLRRELASALKRLARGYGAQGEAERELAVIYARRWLALDPLHELAHQQLMQLYAWTGQQGLALRQYQECVRLLDIELGVAPSMETTQLFETIKARRISPPPSLAVVSPSSKAYVASDPLQPAFLNLQETEPIDLKLPAFVAREDELARLNSFLDLVLAGRGQAVFVIGEAGRGKTALVQELTRQAQVRQPDLIVAGGNCNAYTGLGDPYLPFREILGLLTGDVEGRWAAGAMSQAQVQRLWAFTPYSVQALVNSGPDLIDTFIPGSALLARATAVAFGPSAGSGRNDTAWLVQLKELTVRHAASQSRATVQQSDLFEQFAKVIQTVARWRPLLFVLDDLQWADSGSINLLFHLGRKLERSRVLIVGVYRPAEVALGRPSTLSPLGVTEQRERHPLEALVHEFQRQFGDILIDLGQAEGQQFVDAFLETEPNRLGLEFREALYHHTGGHALFTVEMVRGMQERGDLVRDEQGRWVEGPALNWEILPARVEGVIGERMGRLPPGLLEALKIASIEGEVFRAEVVARLQGVDERTMIRQLGGELDHQHRLVSGQGGQRLGSGGQRLSYYRFRHILFQRYLYRNMDEAERVYLHEAVGKELERVYGEQTETVAVELARHFESAGLMARAADYLYQAGNRAGRLSAHEEALGHFKRGLALLANLPETTERNRQELALQIASFAPLAAVQGYGAADLRRAYGRAQELCEQVGEPGQLFVVLYGLWGYSLVRMDLRTTGELAQQCLALAQSSQKRALLLEGHRMVGETAFYRGDFVPARPHLEQSYALYDPHLHHTHASVYGQDPKIALLSNGSWNLWCLGYPDQALKWSQEALMLAQEWPHPFSQAFALRAASILHLFRREGQTAQARAEAAIALSTEQGFVMWLTMANILRGWTRVEQGEIEEGIVQMRENLMAYRAMGMELDTPYSLTLLAKAHGQSGQITTGLERLDEALALVEKTVGHYWEVELYRLKGELLLQTEARAEALRQAQDEAEKCFWQAIEVARRQRGKSLELRAVMSLSRLWQGQGKRKEARQMLAEIYGWFSEGFATADLQEARALLEALTL